MGKRGRKMLDERKTRILKAIIDDYVQTAVPVASRSLTKKYDFGLSPATIRNEMSDLEELGYLEQPHTSAGRVPSQQAYRLYVDTMMHIPRLSKRELSLMRGYFAGRMLDIQTIVKRTAKALGELTDYTAVVAAVSAPDVTLKHIQLVPVSPGRAMLLMVSDDGRVQEAIIPLPAEIGYRELDMLSAMLNERFRDLTMNHIVAHMTDELGGVFDEQKAVFESVLSSIAENLAQTRPPEMALGGTRNILNHPEYKDLDKARGLLTALETRDVMLELLRNTGELELCVTIGGSEGVMNDCSLVTATIRAGHRQLGAMGVIGPVRMDYPRVVAVLSSMGDSLSEILGDYDKKD